MSLRYVFTSLTRISDLAERDFAAETVDRSEWETGDYVVVEPWESGTRPSRPRVPGAKWERTAAWTSWAGAVSSAVARPGPSC